ncbi:family 1 glycosylhydrolase [Nocardiopsis sp. HNM0947]|uniref:Family 1 glycosylhydrolase n=1 Tax=Nocardiopsis coralli TaxID=2772213 RepID=A0ABR9PAK4_9ACTN|nr:family 1 glycosylhydrolase [Nocardiopsis coralli]MBE3000880.1 family 1 glycosylhydrolase [Nocardiopsis coralli]
MANTLPDGFLWGAATAGHQVEGNNTGSDVWALEHAPGSPLPQRSGDACDSYHRWREDLDIVRDLGLNSYRFGVEWARIEPAPGQFSRAELAHYRRMVEGCLERGITPVVTLHHFASPAWFRSGGGWTSAEGIALFRRYVRQVKAVLDGVPWVCTINEPNMLAMISGVRSAAEEPGDAEGSGDGGSQGLVAGAMPPPDQGVADALMAAHHAAREELSDLQGTAVGWTVANQGFQALDGAEERAAEWALTREDQFLDAAVEDDFIGVQAYTRVRISPDGPVDPPADARRTITGWEFYPQALEGAVRHTAERTGGVPVLVTENGIATASDEERIEYTRGALAGLNRAVRDGVDVRGYLHWSLLDNYEWGRWEPTFGLVSVDRETFVRSVKPSGRWYGDVAREGRLPS